MTGPSATIEPMPASWRSAIEAFAPGPAQRRFRDELGLPTDAPIVMTGHQCTLWHAGIFAKYAAADAARALGATPAWLWVDQDATDAHRVRVPTVEGSTLAEAEWLLDDRRPPGVADAILPPLVAIAPPPETIHPRVRDRAHHAARALARQAKAPSRAAQFAGALRDTVLSRFEAPSIMATALARTTRFGELVERMQQDPRSCAEAYNDAVRAFPDAGVRELSVEGAIELPLWSLEADRPRRAVRADDLAGQLAPRALLMTALVRSMGCELFIHGTGGGVYDRVADRWWRAWLGEGLAPVAVVTATRTLDLLDGPVPTRREVERAKAVAHRAPHDPTLVGDAEAARAKREMLDAIAAAPRHSRERRQRFEEMHRMLERTAAARPDAIERLRRDADDAADRYASRDLAADRTWPAVLFEPGSLDALAGEVAAAFASA